MMIISLNAKSLAIGIAALPPAFAGVVRAGHIGGRITLRLTVHPTRYAENAACLFRAARLSKLR